jgi:hypothetical protein
MVNEIKSNLLFGNVEHLVVSSSNFRQWDSTIWARGLGHYIDLGALTLH